MSAIQSASTWFIILVGVCIVAPYILGVRPGNRRQWMSLTVTIAFLAWMLLFMASLRSR